MFEVLSSPRVPRGGALSRAYCPPPERRLPPYQATLYTEAPPLRFALPNARAAKLRHFVGHILNAVQNVMRYFVRRGAREVRRHVDAVRILAPWRKPGGYGGWHYAPESPAVWRGDAAKRHAQLCTPLRALLAMLKPYRAEAGVSKFPHAYGVPNFTTLNLINLLVFAPQTPICRFALWNGNGWAVLQAFQGFSIACCSSSAQRV